MKINIQKKEITSSRQLTSYLTKFIKDSRFAQVLRKSGQSAVGYHEEKEYMNGDDFILVGGMKTLEEANDMKETLEKFFQDNFAEKVAKYERIVSKVRETFIKCRQVYVEMHKKDLDEETLKTVRYDVVIHKEWKYRDMFNIL